MTDLIAAAPAHAAALAAIHAACFPPAERWDEAAFATLLRAPGAFALIDPEGCCVLARVAADEAEILTLAVAPARRRQGRGASLLRSALRRMAAGGARAVFLEVAADNRPALALYAREAFHEVGRRAGYYPGGIDALVLRRATLDDPGTSGQGAPP